LSTLGRRDEAFEQMQEAIKLGFTDADQLETNDDFKALRTDPRFPDLVESIRKQASSPKS
jgi:predicted RNase H-like HicB family nuclease